MVLVQRHFCVTVYIFDPKKGKFLLIDHKKLEKWLPPGGHIEPDESPETTALRETKEETGLEVEIVGDVFPVGNRLKTPFGIQLNVINPEHEHVDIIYLATPKSDQVTVENIIETNGIGWFSIEEIEKESFRSFLATKQWCRRFYDTFATIGTTR